MRVTFIEVYNEKLRDLLAPSSKQGSLRIRERPHGAIVISGAREVRVSSAEELLDQLEVGALARATGSTRMNKHSSRSHAIFTIIVEQQFSTTKDNSVLVGKLHLVDLAGSERNKRTGNEGIRFKESVRINQGLLALGNVISTLGDQAKRRALRGRAQTKSSIHVPYRDSKLTRFLQDSLGGNARTLFVACVSPAASSFEETHGTLKYANRARNIKNNPVVNDNPEGDQIARAVPTTAEAVSMLRRSSEQRLRNDLVAAQEASRVEAEKAFELKRQLTAC